MQWERLYYSNYVEFHLLYNEQQVLRCILHCLFLCRRYHKWTGGYLQHFLQLIF